jgi:hypothetical protein
MRDIVIGEPLSGYSTALVWSEPHFSVNLGSSNSGAIRPALPVATCEVFGISVLVTDADKYEELRIAWRSNRPADMRKLLVSFVMETIAERPEIFTAILDERYEQGVRNGKSKKAREVRRVLEMD